MVKVHNRARIFAGAITIALGLLFARIVFLVVSTDATAVDQKEGIVRGPILDRRGISLARTEEASAIAIAPP
ncbi:MAG TPA: hypothetical protein PKX74_09095, partial [Leptospiraceae bacterium]|nr:hypothetical protein [Leptospiraceae bacterium]